MTSKSSALLLFVMWSLRTVHCDQWPFEGDEYTAAVVNITYFDSTSFSYHSEAAEMAKYGTGRVGSTSGLLVHVRSGNSSSHHGCTLTLENELPTDRPWIALVSRGKCNFDDKLEAAYLNNASGLIVYNNKDDGLQKMTLRNRYRDKIVAVFITRLKGEELGALVDNGTQVMVHISIGTHYTYRFTNINRTSVMFVSISFIVLMMISLAWLVFYYIQRFRYLHAKDRLSRELCNAAQKALSKIPTRSIKNSDKEVSEAECCAVCIEPYKASDVVRLLPCRHEFHKVCVDPWLLEHRTCPMCKMDILKHYGYVFTGSMESVINVDMDAPIIGGGLTGRPAQRPTPHSPTSSVSVPSSPDAVPASEQSRPRVSAVAAVHRSGASSSPPARRHWSWPRSLVRSSSANNRSAPAASSNSQPATDAQAPASQTQGASIQVEIEGNEATRQSCSENPDVPV